MTECIFCKVALKEIPSEIIRESEEFIAFRDIRPKAPVHVLIIPKNHIGSVRDLKNDENCLVGKLILEAQRVARDLQLDVSGYRLVFNVGRDAGMEIEHLHLHLLGGKYLKFEF